MAEAPQFFVPWATLDNQESVYADFAKWCNRAIPNLENRIYSITYVHDGEEWTATVGEPLRGKRFRITHSRGVRMEREQPISDPAVVLAILTGVPYIVVTNHGIGGRSVGSAWENPFFAGHPKSVTYFSKPQAG
jgi:hypothetical protein